MSQKIRTLIKAPLLSQSGYGHHSREIFQAFLSDSQFEVHVENTVWGNCPFITEDSELKNQIIDGLRKHIVAQHQNQTNYDLFIHITVANEFEQNGKFNIGVTAGIETDRVAHTWVQKCNKMDLIIVPSEHSKTTLAGTIVDWENPNTGERGEIKLNTPIIVCPEGVDTSIFKNYRVNKENIPENITSFHQQYDLEPEFNFLHVGQWGKGGFGEDRKNIGNMLKWFIETFKGRQDVGMVLKTNMSRNNVSDLEAVTNRIEQIKSNFKEEEVPPVYLVHGNLTDEEMCALYSHPKIKACVSFAHGEGFGRPLLEAATCGLPIITTNWSGQLDFLNKGKFSAVDYELKEVPKCAVWEDIIVEGSRWASVKEEDAKHRLKKMVSAYSKPKVWAKELSEKLAEEFDVKVVNQHFIDTIKMALNQKGGNKAVDPMEHLQAFIDTPDDYCVLYQMPMSMGDVYISSAVIDGLVKELPSDAKIYFATNPKYFDVLKNNKNIHKVIPYHQFMMDVSKMEELFDLVLSPNHDSQMVFSNYVRRGQGRLLAEQYANHCICDLGDYFIDKDPFDDVELPEIYCTLHASSGEGQHEARKYVDWPEVIMNLKNMYPDLKVVQIGQEDDMELEVDVDLRGKTTANQLATVVEGAVLHVGIDSFPMHLAAGLGTPLVALFGSSYASSSGPWFKDKENAKAILLEAEARMGCKKACYKYECKVNKNMPCINEIDSFQVFQACCHVLDSE